MLYVPARRLHVSSAKFILELQRVCAHFVSTVHRVHHSCERSGQMMPPFSPVRGLAVFARLEVKKHFESRWQSSEKAATVERIIEITVPRDIQARHDSYRYVTDAFIYEF